MELTHDSAHPRPQHSSRIRSLAFRHGSSLLAFFSHTNDGVCWRWYMNTPPPSAPPSHLIVAFAILYLVWGSTYLGIAVAVESMPPLLMGSGRFIIAGLAFYLLLRLCGAPAPTTQQWRSAAVSGLLLFLGGNGLVCWAEHIVPSGIAALIVAITPLWMTLLPWIAGRSERPTMQTLFGIGIGFMGVAILIGAPQQTADHNGLLLSMAAIVLATVSWACGSLAAKNLPLPSSPWMSSAAQMLCGGIGLGAIGLSLGEQLDLNAITTRSWIAFVYLTGIGSIIGFGSYVYLLKHSTMTRVSTYAFVNPIVAVALGWLIANEPINLRTGGAGLLIVIAVVIILKPAAAKKIS
jgi:drug/metabolite transporter (DMT)-like permease